MDISDLGTLEGTIFQVKLTILPCVLFVHLLSHKITHAFNLRRLKIVVQYFEHPSICYFDPILGMLKQFGLKISGVSPFFK